MESAHTPAPDTLGGWAKLADAQRADIEAHVRGLTDDAETYNSPAHGWTCFHCGETFWTEAGARLHFGEAVTGRPYCVEVAPEGRFWLVLHEPGNVPQRKGPWPQRQIKSVLREFMAARPTAYIDVLTLEVDGPNVQHGPEVLQILDGRSMGVGRRHNARTREAHGGFHADLEAVNGRLA